MKLNKAQQALLGIVIVLLVIIAGEFLFFKDKKQRIRTLHTEIADLEMKIGEANRIKKHAAELQEEMNHLKAQLDRLKKILPVKINKPKFFQDIRRYANEHQLEVQQISHNDQVVDDVIVEHPFTFNTRGNYHDLGDFFAKLSNYPRIINVKGLSIEKVGEYNSAYSIQAGFIVSVFTYKEPTPEELKAQIEAKRLERMGGDEKTGKRRGRRR